MEFTLISSSWTLLLNSHFKYLVEDETKETDINKVKSDLQETSSNQGFTIFGNQAGGHKGKDKFYTSINADKRKSVNCCALPFNISSYVERCRKFYLQAWR